jgi:hypothetical protein
MSVILLSMLFYVAQSSDPVNVRCQAQEYLLFNEKMVNRYDGITQRTIKLVRVRVSRQLLRSAVNVWHVHTKGVSRCVW